MKGFSEQWSDLPDYILGITKEIWEGRGLATLNHYYAENIPMRFPEVFRLVISARSTELYPPWPNFPIVN